MVIFLNDFFKTVANKGGSNLTERRTDRGQILSHVHVNMVSAAQEIRICSSVDLVAMLTDSPFPVTSINNAEWISFVQAGVCWTPVLLLSVTFQSGGKDASPDDVCPPANSAI